TSATSFRAARRCCSRFTTNSPFCKVCRNLTGWGAKMQAPSCWDVCFSELSSPPVKPSPRSPPSSQPQNTTSPDQPLWSGEVASATLSPDTSEETPARGRNRTPAKQDRGSRFAARRTGVEEHPRRWAGGEVKRLWSWCKTSTRVFSGGRPAVKQETQPVRVGIPSLQGGEEVNGDPYWLLGAWADSYASRTGMGIRPRSGAE